MASKKPVKSGKKDLTAKTQRQPDNSKVDLKKIKVFVTEVRNEFGKIAWPDKKHTVATTGVVVLLVFMVSFYLGAVDLVLGKFIGYVIK